LKYYAKITQKEDASSTSTGSTDAKTDFEKFLASSSKMLPTTPNERASIIQRQSRLDATTRPTPTRNPDTADNSTSILESSGELTTEGKADETLGGRDRGQSNDENSTAQAATTTAAKAAIKKIATIGSKPNRGIKSRLRSKSGPGAVAVPAEETEEKQEEEKPVNSTAVLEALDDLDNLNLEDLNKLSVLGDNLT